MLAHWVEALALIAHRPDAQKNPQNEKRLTGWSV